MPEYIKHKNILWKKYQGGLIPENPPHVPVILTQAEQKYLLTESGCWFIRWPSNWDIQTSSPWWYIIKDNFIGMEELSRNTRSKLRRALKKQYVIKVNAEEIIHNGYAVYKEAFRSYKTFLKPMSKQGFEDYVRSLNPDTWEFFACYNMESNEMTAYSQNLVMNQSAEYKIIKLHPEFLKSYPSYALIFKMNEYYLQEQGLKYVNDGSRSISHQTNIQQFLQDKFKFRKAFCKLNVRYKFWLALLIRLIFPFRVVFRHVPGKTFKRLSILMKQEEIRRQCSKINSL